MKYVLLFLTFLSLFGLSALAGEHKDVSNDFGNYESDKKAFSVNDLRKQLEVRGEIFVLDSTGQHLLDGVAEWREWRANNKLGTIESNWSYTSNLNKPVALHHVWKISDDGTIHVTIEQYERIDKDGKGEVNYNVKYNHLLKKQEFTVTDFSPIIWQSVVETDKRVIARLVPSLRPPEESRKLGEVPLSGKDSVMRDNLGRVWSDHLNFTGEYVGLRTHKGSVFMSFIPFKGSKELGWAKGNDLTLDLGSNLSTTITSTTAFVPADIKAKIYGVYKPDVSTERFSSTNIMTTNLESQFLPQIEMREIH